MQLIKDKIKIRWNKTGKTFKHFQTSMILKVSKQKPCSNPISKFVCGKPMWRKNALLFKKNRPHNLETLEWIHAKCGTLSQTSLMLNYG